MSRPWLRPRYQRAPERSYHYDASYLGAAARHDIVAWLTTLHPLWEMRYSTRRPPPPGKEQRGLLRPVYWLGNWQFACLGYYGVSEAAVHDRAVAAEPFPPVLARIVDDVERLVRDRFSPADVPRGWRLNTCLVNFYGRRRDATSDRWIDVARVGDHRDFEPGPVASLSIGERALFQFVRRGGGAPVRTQWLDDGSLQAFGGPKWKDQLFHRVQRVDDRRGIELPPAIDGFVTRRINFTFRWVPDHHVTPVAALGGEARADIADYVAELARYSTFWSAATGAPPAKSSGGD